MRQEIKEFLAQLPETVTHLSKKQFIQLIQALPNATEADPAAQAQLHHILNTLKSQMVLELYINIKAQLKDIFSKQVHKDVILALFDILLPENVAKMSNNDCFKYLSLSFRPQSTPLEHHRQTITQSGRYNPQAIRLLNQLFLSKQQQKESYFDSKWLTENINKIYSNQTQTSGRINPASTKQLLETILQPERTLTAFKSISGIFDVELLSMLNEAEITLLEQHVSLERLEQNPSFMRQLYEVLFPCSEVAFGLLHSLRQKITAEQQTYITINRLTFIAKWAGTPACFTRLTDYYQQQYKKNPLVLMKLHDEKKATCVFNPTNGQNILYDLIRDQKLNVLTQILKKSHEEYISCLNDRFDSNILHFIMRHYPDSATLRQQLSSIPENICKQLSTKYDTLNFTPVLYAYNNNQAINTLHEFVTDLDCISTNGIYYIRDPKKTKVSFQQIEYGINKTSTNLVTIRTTRRYCQLISDNEHLDVDVKSQCKKKIYTELTYLITSYRHTSDILLQTSSYKPTLTEVVTCLDKLTALQKKERNYQLQVKHLFQPYQIYRKTSDALQALLCFVKTYNAIQRPQMLHQLWPYLKKLEFWSINMFDPEYSIPGLLARLITEKDIEYSLALTKELISSEQIEKLDEEFFEIKNHTIAGFCIMHGRDDILIYLKSLSPKTSFITDTHIADAITKKQTLCQTRHSHTLAPVLFHKNQAAAYPPELITKHSRDNFTSLIMQIGAVDTIESNILQQLLGEKRSQALQKFCLNKSSEINYYDDYVQYIEENQFENMLQYNLHHGTPEDTLKALCANKSLTLVTTAIAQLDSKRFTTTPQGDTQNIFLGLGQASKFRQGIKDLTIELDLAHTIKAAQQTSLWTSLHRASCEKQVSFSKIIGKTQITYHYMRPISNPQVKNLIAIVHFYSKPYNQNKYLSFSYEGHIFERAHHDVIALLTLLFLRQLDPETQTMIQQLAAQQGYKFWQQFCTFFLDVHLHEFKLSGNINMDISKPYISINPSEYVPHYALQKTPTFIPNLQSSTLETITKLQHEVNRYKHLTNIAPGTKTWQLNVDILVQHILLNRDTELFKYIMQNRQDYIFNPYHIIYHMFNLLYLNTVHFIGFAGCDQAHTQRQLLDFLSLLITSQSNSLFCDTIPQLTLPLFLEILLNSTEDISLRACELLNVNLSSLPYYLMIALNKPRHADAIAARLPIFDSATQDQYYGGGIINCHQVFMTLIGYIQNNQTEALNQALQKLFEDSNVCKPNTLLCLLPHAAITAAQIDCLNILKQYSKLLTSYETLSPLLLAYYLHPNNKTLITACEKDWQQPNNDSHKLRYEFNHSMLNFQIFIKHITTQSVDIEFILNYIPLETLKNYPHLSIDCLTQIAAIPMTILCQTFKSLESKSNENIHKKEKLLRLMALHIISTCLLDTDNIDNKLTDILTSITLNFDDLLELMCTTIPVLNQQQHYELFKNSKITKTINLFAILLNSSEQPIIILNAILVAFKNTFSNAKSKSTWSSKFIKKLTSRIKVKKHLNDQNEFLYATCIRQLLFNPKISPTDFKKFISEEFNFLIQQIPTNLLNPFAFNLAATPFYGTHDYNRNHTFDSNSNLDWTKNSSWLSTYVKAIDCQVPPLLPTSEFTSDTDSKLNTMIKFMVRHGRQIDIHQFHYINSVEVFTDQLEALELKVSPLTLLEFCIANHKKSMPDASQHAQQHHHLIAIIEKAHVSKTSALLFALIAAFLTPPDQLQSLSLLDACWESIAQIPLNDMLTQFWAITESLTKAIHFFTNHYINNPTLWQWLEAHKLTMNEGNKSYINIFNILLLCFEHLSKSKKIENTHRLLDFYQSYHQQIAWQQKVILKKAGDHTPASLLINILSKYSDQQELWFHIQDQHPQLFEFFKKSELRDIFGNNRLSSAIPQALDSIKYNQHYIIQIFESDLLFHIESLPPSLKYADTHAIMTNDETMKEMRPAAYWLTPDITISQFDHFSSRTKCEILSINLITLCALHNNKAQFKVALSSFISKRKKSELPPKLNMISLVKACLNAKAFDTLTLFFETFEKIDIKLLHQCYYHLSVYKNHFHTLGDCTLKASIEHLDTQLKTLIAKNKSDQLRPAPSRSSSPTLFGKRKIAHVITKPDDDQEEPSPGQQQKRKSDQPHHHDGGKHPRM